MIKANMNNKEVRIGNLVYRFGEVWEFGEHDFSLDFEHFTPIPLTPEILDKAGFEKAGVSVGHFYNHKIDWAYYLSCQELHVGCDDGNGYEIPTKVKHLHQLQNLYFALTGKELDITL